MGCNLSISYQDFKERKVYFLLFIGAAILGGSLHFIKTISWYTFMQSCLINYAFLAIIILVLSAYSRFKMQKKLTNTLGLGDILFFIVIATAFPTLSFLVLFSLSLIFSLILFLILKSSLQHKTVPLAGLQALFISLVMIVNLLFNFVDVYAI